MLENSTIIINGLSGALITTGLSFVIIVVFVKFIKGNF